jgi:TonB family protein
MFAPLVQRRRSPASVAFSAALHLGVAFAGIWAAELRALETPRPPRTSITFLTVVPRLPEIARASDPVAAAPARQIAKAPAVDPPPPLAVMPDVPVAHELTARPLDTRRIDATLATAVVAPEPAAVNSIPAPPIVTPTPVAVGGFDRAQSDRRSPDDRRAGIVVAAGLQGARAAPVPPAAAADTVRRGGFDVSTPAPRAAAAPRPPEPLDVPVDIAFKPTPAYTDEARALRIQGEVILEVEFTALRLVRVLRVVQGLGHGLDESAATAARGIRFTPAQRAGQSVDVRTLVHIVFQLS